MTKITKFLALIVFSVIAFSCSDDDDAKSEDSLENVSMSLSSSNSVITPPTAMANSQNEYAMEANSYITMANAMTGYMQYFKPPQGSTKSSTPITAANGRTAATQTEYLVYTWSDAQSGMSVAYQVSEQSGKYVFEAFIKMSADADWLRYLYVEETKDGSEGLMRIYDAFYGEGNEVILNYSWKRTGDVFDFLLTGSDQDYPYVVHININQKTKAGFVEYTLDGELLYKMTWDAAGNGTWAYYVDGEVDESGSWEV